MNLPDDLKRLYRDGRVLPFIGAGVSGSVTWQDGPTIKRGLLWRDVVDQAACLLGFNDPNLLRIRGSDLQILEYLKRSPKGIAPLRNWFFSQMQPPEDELIKSKLHAELARLDKCSVFYTTNYDNFIERAFGLHGRASVVVAQESDMGQRLTANQCEIIKFHGDFDHPDQMVVTGSDYQKRLSLRTPLDYRFRSDLLGRAVVFIGYSFSDINVEYLFHLVNEQHESLPQSASGRRAYIVFPEPSDFEHRLFQARNMEVIPVRERTMTDDIADILAEMRA